MLKQDQIVIDLRGIRENSAILGMAFADHPQAEKFRREYSDAYNGQAGLIGIIAELAAQLDEYEYSFQGKDDSMWEHWDWYEVTDTIADYYIQETLENGKLPEDPEIIVKRALKENFYYTESSAVGKAVEYIVKMGGRH